MLGRAVVKDPLVVTVLRQRERLKYYRRRGL